MFVGWGLGGRVGDLVHRPLDKAIKFRLETQKLPIETGRWKGIGRADRVCTECKLLKVMGSIFLCIFLFKCTTIRRDDLMLPEDLAGILKSSGCFLVDCPTDGC